MDSSSTRLPNLPMTGGCPYLFASHPMFGCSSLVHRCHSTGSGNLVPAAGHIQIVDEGLWMAGHLGVVVLDVGLQSVSLVQMTVVHIQDMMEI